MRERVGALLMLTGLGLAAPSLDAQTSRTAGHEGGTVLPLATAPAFPLPAGCSGDCSTARLLAGGLLGGAAGAVAGGLAGLWIGGNRCSVEGNPDSCRGLEGFAIGTVSGEAFGIPLGVHVANGRAGRLLPSVAASAAWAAAGVGTIAATRSSAVALSVAVAVPAAQLLTSLWIERATSRR